MPDHSVALLSNLGQSHVESDILAQANIKNRKKPPWQQFLMNVTGRRERRSSTISRGRKVKRDGEKSWETVKPAASTRARIFLGKIMTSDTRDAFLRLSTQKALVLLFQAQGQNLQASQLRRRQAREPWEAPAEAVPLRARSYGMSRVWWHGGSFRFPKAEFISTPQSLIQLPQHLSTPTGKYPRQGDTAAILWISRT